MSRSKALPIVNGHIGAKVIERVLSNGITARTSPLSPYASARLQRLAEEKYPDAPKAPYMHEHPDSVLPVLDEPGWKAAQQKALNERWDFWSELVIGACVDITDDHAALVAGYAPYIARLRQHLELPADEWEATLLYAILEDRADINDLLKDAQGLTPVTAGEVDAGLRIFRSEVHEPSTGDV